MQIGNQGILDGSVTTPKLADGSVTTPKLAGLAVTAAKLAAGAAAGNITANTLTDSMIQALGRFSLFTASGTFSAPKTGNYLCLGMGGGGGGGGGRGVVAGSTLGGTGGQGGQGSALQIGIVTLAAGTDYTVTVGAGGAGGHGGTPAGQLPGASGGDTTLGSVYTATGGEGGPIDAQSVAPNAYGCPGTRGNGAGGGAGAAAQYAANASGNLATPASHYGAGGGGGGGASSGASEQPGSDGAFGASGLLLILW